MYVTEDVDWECLDPKYPSAIERRSGHKAKSRYKFLEVSPRQVYLKLENVGHPNSVSMLLHGHTLGIFRIFTPNASDQQDQILGQWRYEHCTSTDCSATSGVFNMPGTRKPLPASISFVSRVSSVTKLTPRPKGRAVGSNLACWSMIKHERNLGHQILHERKRHSSKTWINKGNCKNVVKLYEKEWTTPRN